MLLNFISLKKNSPRKTWINWDQITILNIKLCALAFVVIVFTLDFLLGVRDHVLKKFKFRNYTKIN